MKRALGMGISSYLELIEMDFTETNIRASSSTVTDGCECAHFAPKPAYRFV
jgi:hypothetical protein